MFEVILQNMVLGWKMFEFNPLLINAALNLDIQWGYMRCTKNCDGNISIIKSLICGLW